MLNEANKANIINITDLNRWLGEVDRIEEEREQVKGAYQEQCADLNKRKKGVMKAAKAAGIPMQALKTNLKIRDKLRQAAALAKTIPIEEKPAAEIIAEQAKLYGDLPFGDYLSRVSVEIKAREDEEYAAHAARNAGAIDSLTDDDDSDGEEGDDFDETDDPRPRFLKDKAGETVTGDDALDRLRDGIKQLAH
jgi:uncharacterized protein (UPF0335 family)